MQICPSILEYRAEDYFTTIKKLSPYYQYFQIDLADGIYVDNKTASLEDFLKLTTNYQSLINPLTFDFHLMVKDYEKEIKKLINLKSQLTVKNIFVHYGLFPNLISLTNNYSRFNIGLVINPQDQIYDLVKHYPLDNIPVIQIMSVNPGAQGKSFIAETLKKIEQLRISGYRNKIFLDGAINNKTLPIINSLKYKPDIICPGSFLTKTENLLINVDYLLKMI